MKTPGFTKSISVPDEVTVKASPKGGSGIIFCFAEGRCCSSCSPASLLITSGTPVLWSQDKKKKTDEQIARNDEDRQIQYNLLIIFRLKSLRSKGLGQLLTIFSGRLDTLYKFDLGNTYNCSQVRIGFILLSHGLNITIKTNRKLLNSINHH